MKIQKLAVKILVLTAIFLGIYTFHRSGSLHSMMERIEHLGPSAPFVFLLVYTIATICFIPSSILTFAGGFIFSFWTAAALSILGSGLGAVSAFLIGRYLARTLVEKQASRMPQFEKIAVLVQKKGWKIVLLARLSPLFPFLIGNYAFGITRMCAREYFFASLAGTIPSALVYTYSGHLAGSLAGAGSHVRTSQEWVLLALGLAATVGISIYLQRLAQAELRH